MTTRAFAAVVLVSGLVGAAGTARADEIGTPSVVAPAPAENVMLSGDGSYVLYASHGVYGRSVAASAATLLSPATPDRFRLDVSADGSVIAFITASGEAHAINRPRGADEVIATGLAPTDRIAVASLATTVWYSRTSGSATTLHEHDTATPASAPNADAPLPLRASASAFVVDGHGDRVLYSSPGVTAVRQYLPADGTDAVLLDFMSLTPDNGAVSPSGRYLADGVIIIDLGTKRILTVGTAGGSGGFVSGVRPRFSLDEHWLAVSGGFRPGAWLVPVDPTGAAHRVTHADDLNGSTRFPVTVDPSGTQVAYTSLADPSGPTYASYISPVAFDTTPPQVDLDLRDGDAVAPRTPVTVHLRDGGSGIDHVTLAGHSSSGGDFSNTLDWWSMQCTDDSLGVRDDRDCAATFSPYLLGDATITATAVDVDGNVATRVVHVVMADTTAPTVTGSPDRVANAAGWYRAPVTLRWTATDPDSTVVNPPATTVSTNGAHQVIRSAAVCDQSQNCATGTYTLSIDQVPPTVTASTPPIAGGGGWYRSPTRVTFDCSDALSGIAACPSPVTVSTEGRNQIVQGVGGDVAGNLTSAQAAVNVDMTPPRASATSGPLVLASFGQRVTGTADDALSGISRVAIVMSNGTTTASVSSDANTVTLTCDQARTSCTWSFRPPISGRVTFQVLAYDLADNVVTTSGSAIVL